MFSHLCVLLAKKRQQKEKDCKMFIHISKRLKRSKEKVREKVGFVNQQSKRGIITIKWWQFDVRQSNFHDKRSWTSVHSFQNDLKQNVLFLMKFVHFTEKMHVAQIYTFTQICRKILGWIVIIQITKLTFYTLFNMTK